MIRRPDKQVHGMASQTLEYQDGNLEYRYTFSVCPVSLKVYRYCRHCTSITLTVSLYWHRASSATAWHTAFFSQLQYMLVTGSFVSNNRCKFFMHAFTV